jgi:hypothetical protein
MEIKYREQGFVTAHDPYCKLHALPLAGTMATKSSHTNVCHIVASAIYSDAINTTRFRTTAASFRPNKVVDRRLALRLA